MFRFIGLAWDAASAESSSTAHRLAQRLTVAPAWTTVLQCPGLEVHATGMQPRGNRVSLLHEDKGVVLGTLFRRSDLLVEAPVGVTPTDEEAAQILASKGRSLVADFWGRYIAFIQSSQGATSVLRDPSGTLPCFFMRHQQVTIVFSWLEDLLELLGDANVLRINEDALAAHLRTGVLGGRETALADVSQVLPGEVVALHGERSTLLWNPVDIAAQPEEPSFDDAATALRNTVRACTRAWAACHDALLHRLSGGLDSSIMLSCLTSGSTEADVLCVNYHSPGSDSDERLFARSAAARCGRDLIERQREADFRIDRLCTIARMPTPVSYVGWMNSRTDARLASAHGASAMFTGAGGDALFYEIPRWWPAADYLRVRGLDWGFPAAALDAARLGRVSLWHAAGQAIVERMQPRLAARTFARPPRFLSRALLDMQPDPERFAPPWSRAAGETLSIGKHMQLIGLAQPIGYYDPFERDAAPEIVNPLLSQPLVELCLSWPTYLLTRGGQGRALARRAFVADLPTAISQRRSKGGLEEHTVSVLQSNLDLARGWLLEGELARRGLVDRPKLEELLANKPTALPVPIRQIHALIATESWLTRWLR